VHRVEKIGFDDESVSDITIFFRFGFGKYDDGRSVNNSSLAPNPANEPEFLKSITGVDHVSNYSGPIHHEKFQFFIEYNVILDREFCGQFMLQLYFFPLQIEIFAWNFLESPG
jgi:hypothetical protein